MDDDLVDNGLDALREAYRVLNRSGDRTAGQDKAIKRANAVIDEAARLWRNDLMRQLDEHYDRVATKAWKDLQSHGIAGATIEVLWMYYVTRSGVLPRSIETQAETLLRAIGATARAIEIAEERKSDPNASRFMNAAQEKIAELATLQWFSSTQTVLDAVMSIPGLADKPLQELASTVARHVEQVRWETGKPYLAVLRDWAKRHGLELSWYKIACLSKCAFPESGVQAASIERSLYRWAKTGVDLQRRKLLARLEEILDTTAGS